MRATAVPVRRFAIHGPCDPQSHHVLEPVDRLPRIGGQPLDGRLLAGGAVALQGPPAAGRTTAIRALAAHLRQRGATPIVLDAHGLDGPKTLARAEVRLLDQIRRAARGAPDGHDGPGHGPWRIGGPWQLLAVALDDWSRRTDRPLVALVDDADRFAAPIAGLLRAQLAASRVRGVLLAGVDDPRGVDNGRLGQGAARVRQPALGRRDIATLYALHAADTGQVFAESALTRVERWTGGHPWLVCAIARELLDGMGHRGPIDRQHVDRAVARLLDAWPPWFDRLTAALEDQAIRRAVLPLIPGTAPVGADAPGDIERARDRGLLAAEAGRAAGAMQMAAILHALGHGLGGRPALDPTRCRRPDGGVDLPRVITTLAGACTAGPAPTPDGSLGIAQLAPIVRATGIVERLLPPGGVMWRGGFGARQLVGRIDLALTGRRRQQAVIAIKCRVADDPHPLERGLSDLDRLIPPGGEGALVLFDHRAAGRARLTWEVPPSGREVLVVRA